VIDPQSYRHLTIAKDGGVTTVALNRAHALNAIDGGLHEELARCFHELNGDDDTRLVVLTGAGRAFCAGGDLAWLGEVAKTPGAFHKIMRDGKRIVFGMLDLEVPMICRMNGDAIGLGATLALFCDIVIAVDSARIGDPHVRVGLVAGDGGAVIWPQLIGYARAKEMLLTGDLLDAPKAVEWGLINRAVPADALDETVDAMARKLMRGAQPATRWTKVAANLGLRQLAHAVLDASLAYEGLSSASADHREGVAAAAEKRRAAFRGE
jgi:enoyl-CoA hydratase